MDLDKMTLARARLALREAVRAHLFDRNVGLIDFGQPKHGDQIAENELAIRVHVRRKLSGPALEAAVETGQTRPIPPSIAGFPTDVPEGIYRPQQWGARRIGWGRPSAVNPRMVHANPLRGGLSISDEYHYTAGTLGGLVVDRATGAEMILSNWHVLVAGWGARAGQRIYQPGRLDGGTSLNTVATLTRDAMSVNLDAAVATLNNNCRLINDQLDLGSVSGVGPAELGMRVIKSGRTSGITSGRVTAIEGVAKIPYGYVERIIRHVVTIEPHLNFEDVSAAGDSGAWWLDPLTGRAIGLHFAGSNFPERGLALNMPAVLDALDVDIVTAVERIESYRVASVRHTKLVGV
ncbi:MAG: S1 family peptidase [Anaerolineae bacterium]|nr:S1 family peptidase [Anaerolineae bacterium]